MLLGKGSCKKGERKQEEGRKERRNKMGEIDEKKKPREDKERATAPNMQSQSFPRLTLN